MASIFLHGTSGEIAMPGTVGIHTLLQLQAGAARRVRVTGWGIAFKGTNVTDAPVLVALMRQSNQGVGMTNVTSTNLTYKNPLDTETISSTLWKGIPSSEPAVTVTIENFEVQPQLGYRIWYPAREGIIIANGTTLCWAITSLLAWNVDVEFDCEE